jgi:hypothetical protein
MNIEKLERILHEMEAADFNDLAAAQVLVRQWAGRISNAITEHLLAELGADSAALAPDMSPEPGGHNWGNE